MNIRATKVVRLRATLSTLILAPLLSMNLTAAEVLFEEDFSGDISGGPNPVWSWDKQSDVRRGMMLSEGDVYEVAEAEAFMSSRRALRINFAGRNSHCNSCGGSYTKITSVSDNKACLITERGAHEDYVFNLENYFSTWNIVERSSDGHEVCFDTSRPAQRGVGQARPSVEVGDSVFVPHQCGTNGNVGSSAYRRSDCNKAVNYLQGVSSKDLGYGETLSRRFYLYIDEDAELPDITMKLGYSSWYKNGRTHNSTLKISTQRDRALALTMPNGQRTGSGDFKVPLGKWMYFEEVFKRESSASANDATYTLYVSPIDEYTDEPFITVDNFTLGELRRISIGGNWQHENDASGYAYIDNIVIAKGFVGPVSRPVVASDN